MRIHCIRHGLSDDNLAGRYNGTNDDALTKPQREDLLRVPFVCSSYDAVFCSPLKRCIETAECLRISHRTTEPRIQERSLGIFEGLTAEECQQQFPTEYASFLAFDADFVIPLGESRGQHWERVCRWIREVSSKHRNILAITHGGTIDFLYRLGASQSLYGGDRIFGGRNANLSTFEVRWPEVRIVAYSVPLDA